MYVLICTYKYKCMHIHISFICTYICMFVHVYVWIYVYIHIHTHTFVYLCMHMHVYILDLSYMFISLYTCVHTHFYNYKKDEATVQGCLTSVFVMCSMWHCTFNVSQIPDNVIFRNIQTNDELQRHNPLNRLKRHLTFSFEAFMGSHWLTGGVRPHASLHCVTGLHS